jgi:O-antigen/teichoic acid export membrane protein
MNFKNFITKLVRHELIAGSFWLFIGGMIGNFLAFIFNIFLARTLSYSNYGIYVSLLSLYSLLTIPAGSLTAVIVRFATHYFAKDETDKASAFYKQMTLLWLVIGTAVGFVIFLSAPLLLNFLHINNTSYILIVAVAVGISYLGIVNNAFLQSLTKFFYISFSAVMASSSRLIIGGSLVLIGFGALGALGGFIAMPIVALFLGFIPLFYLFRRTKEKVSIDFKEILIYAAPVSVGLLSLSSFITSDVILVKHFFHADMAGLYGGLSIVGKVLFYFTAFIPSVMFPLVVKRHAKGEEYKNLYLLAFILILLPSVAITIFYFLFPQFTLNLFLGKNYLIVAPFLGLFGIFITLFNLVSLTVSFFLSIKKTIVSTFVLFFAALQIILIYLFHSDFYQIIFASITSLSLLLALLLLYFLKEERHKT